MDLQASALGWEKQSLETFNEVQLSTTAREPRMGMLARIWVLELTAHSARSGQEQSWEWKRLGNTVS